MNQSILESERSMALESEDQYSVANSTCTGGIVASEDSFELIEELQNHGVGMADIQKLRQSGICTIKGK